MFNFSKLVHVILLPICLPKVAFELLIKWFLTVITKFMWLPADSIINFCIANHLSLATVSHVCTMLAVLIKWLIVLYIIVATYLHKLAVQVLVFYETL